MTSQGGEETNAAALEGWVREELDLDPDASVLIAEQAGTDPRCSPVVTSVEIVAGAAEPYSFHIERPLDEVVRIDLIAALAFGGGH